MIKHSLKRKKTKRLNDNNNNKKKNKKITKNINIINKNNVNIIKFFNRVFKSADKNLKPKKYNLNKIKNQIRPKIVNIISRFSIFEKTETNFRIDLTKLISKIQCAEYSPHKFAAVTCRMTYFNEPNSTALIFNTGIVIVARSSTENQSLFSCHLYRKLIESTQFIHLDRKTDDYIKAPFYNKLQFNNWNVANIVISLKITNKNIDIYQLKQAYSKEGTYIPDNYPAFIYRYKLNNGKKYTAMIFDTGKVNILGLNSVPETYEATAQIKKIVDPFPDKNLPSNSGVKFKYRIDKMMNGGCNIPVMKGDPMTEKEIVEMDQQNNEKMIDFTFDLLNDC